MRSWGDTASGLRLWVLCGLLACGALACSINRHPVPLPGAIPPSDDDAGLDCPEGATASATDPTSCVDIDECELGTDRCDDEPAATCRNMQFTYRCTCPSNTIDVDRNGYDCEPHVVGDGDGEGDGDGDISDDACALGTDNCDDDPEACVDQAEGFLCRCPAGYRDVNDDGTECENIDECELQTDDCDRAPVASCKDTSGSFECTCPEGYDGNGKLCRAICGDGLVRALEGCDDDNDKSGDGCDESCKIEAGYACDDDEPTECGSVCGNGLWNEGEACDDDGREDDDGCDDTCQVEATHVCARFPSRCEEVADVAIVDDGAACPGEGTVAAPYCSITASLATGKSILFVRPGEYRENVTITGRTLDVFAEDGAMLGATAVDQPALRISGGANVTITGLAIRDGLSRVSVESASATIVQTQVGPGTLGVGVISNGNASVTLLQSRVVGNLGGGVDLGGSGAAVLENTVVSGNGSLSSLIGGVRIATAPIGSRIENVTVADNISDASVVAGIACGSASLAVVSSIVWGNHASVAISTVSDNCAVTYSDLDAAIAGAGNISSDPSLVLPSYHLAGTSPALDAGDPSAVLELDYDGEVRPRGDHVDMGAFELSSRAPFPSGRPEIHYALDEQTANPGPAYLGRYPVGLYPGSSFVMPRAHKEAGFVAANAVVSRNVDGTPNVEDGKNVTLALGGTTMAELMCTGDDLLPPAGFGSGPFCSPQSMIGRVSFGPGERLDREHSYIVNGAYLNQFAQDYTQNNTPAFPSVPLDGAYPTVNGNYTRILERVMSTFSSDPISEAQVQAVMLEVANRDPVVSLPDRHADAVELMVRLGNIVRLIKIRYPNLQVVLISSRPHSPPSATAPFEPYAYETGFAVKWLIAAQIDQMREGHIVDTRAGNLDYESGAAPFIAWGPYLWGHQAGSQMVGVRWFEGDFENVPSGFFTTRGESKASLQMLRHMLMSPFLKCFLLEIGTCQ